MWQFIVGSIYTILILAVGGIIGYYTGNKEIEKKIEEVKRLKQAKKPISSAIKSIPKKQQRINRNSEINKQKDLIDGV